MVTQFNLKYSISAAFRIISAKLSAFGKVAMVEKVFRVRGRLFNAVYRIRIGSKVYRWARFIGVDQFEAHFVEKRKEDAKKMIVTPSDCGDFCDVFNPDKNTTYQVFWNTDELRCNCEDYCNQKKFSSTKPVCKHGYAALFYQGYQTIEDFADEVYRGFDEAEKRYLDSRSALGF